MPLMTSSQIVNTKLSSHLVLLKVAKIPLMEIVTTCSSCSWSLRRNQFLGGRKRRRWARLVIFQELQEIPEFELGNLVGLVNKEEATEQVGSHTIKAPKSREEVVLGIYVKSHAKAYYTYMC